MKGLDLCCKCISYRTALNLCADNIYRRMKADRQRTGAGYNDVARRKIAIKSSGDSDATLLNKEAGSVQANVSCSSTGARETLWSCKGEVWGADLTPVNGVAGCRPGR